jgi:hypothetical protein
LRRPAPEAILVGVRGNPHHQLVAEVLGEFLLSGEKQKWKAGASKSGKGMKGEDAGMVGC